MVIKLSLMVIKLISISATTQPSMVQVKLVDPEGHYFLNQNIYVKVGFASLKLNCNAAVKLRFTCAVPDAIDSSTTTYYNY